MDLNEFNFLSGYDAAFSLLNKYDTACNSIKSRLTEFECCANIEWLRRILTILVSCEQILRILEEWTPPIGRFGYPHRRPRVPAVSGHKNPSMERIHERCAETRDEVEPLFDTLKSILNDLEKQT